MPAYVKHFDCYRLVELFQLVLSITLIFMRTSGGTES
jgi:hypothetical protein